MVTPSMAVAQSYQSNPLARSDELDRIDDFVTVLTPQLALIRETQFGSAVLALRSDSRLYRDLTELNTLDPSATFKLSELLTPRLTFFSDASWAYSKATDPQTIDGFVVSGERPDVTTWSASGGLGYDLSPISGIRLNLSHNSTEYDTSGRIRTVRDRDGSALSLSYNRSLSAREQIRASLSYQLTDFVETAPQTGIAGRESQDDTQIAMTLSYLRRLGPHSTLNLTGGVRSLESEGSGFSNARFRLPDGSFTNLPLDEQSTAFTGGVQYTRTFRRSSLTLGFDQQTRPASGRSSSIDVQTYTATFNRKLTRRITLKLSASLSDRASASDNFATVNAGVVSPGVFLCPDGSLLGVRDDPDGVTRPVCAFRVKSAIDEQMRLFAVHLDWRVAERFTSFLSYDYSDRDSPSILANNYDNHRISVGIRYSFDIDVP